MSLFKKLFCFFGFVLFVTQAYSQNFVGINTNSPTEILDVNGTMRVRKLPVNGEQNAVNSGSSGTSLGTFTPNRSVVANSDGVLGSAPIATSWFYMPPMNLPITSDDSRYSASDNIFTINLYEEYQRQFSLPSGSSVSTAGAPALVTIDANQLDFYVTYYDHTVFEAVSLTDGGLLKYRVKPLPNVSQDTFFTVIFRVR